MRADHLAGDSGLRIRARSAAASQNQDGGSTGGIVAFWHDPLGFDTAGDSPSLLNQRQSNTATMRNAD